MDHTTTLKATFQIPAERFRIVIPSRADLGKSGFPISVPGADGLGIVPILEAEGAMVELFQQGGLLAQIKLLLHKAAAGQAELLP